MDITDEHLTVALQEALTRHLAFLHHSQNERESKLPHQGKGIETTIDVTTEEYFQTRIAATESFLQYTDRIARDVRRWMIEKLLGEGDIETEEKAEEEISRYFGQLKLGPTAVVDEEPFLDIFSGKWIQPVTPFSAGPSGDRSAEKAALDPPLQISLSESKPSHPFPGQSPAPPSPSSVTIPTPKSPKSPSTSISSSAGASRPSIDVPTPQSSPSYQILGQMPRIFSNLVRPFSTVFSHQTSPTSTVPSSTASTPTFDSDSPTTSISSSLLEDAATARRLQEQYESEDIQLERQRQYALSLQNPAAPTQAGMSQLELDILEAQLLQDEFEEQEIRALSELSRAAAASLQQQWEAEDALLVEQENYVKGVVREEERRQARIEADFLVAQKAQQSWEIESRLQEEQVRRIADETARAEELKRRKEAIRVAERERKASVERERLQREENDRRAKELEVRHLTIG